MVPLPDQPTTRQAYGQRYAKGGKDQQVGAAYQQRGRGITEGGRAGQRREVGQGLQPRPVGEVFYREKGPEKGNIGVMKRKIGGLKVSIFDTREVKSILAPAKASPPRSPPSAASGKTSRPAGEATRRKPPS